MTHDQIAKSFQISRENWNAWKCVFEHSGSIEENPLLAEPKLFAHFLREYSVDRTVCGGKHDEFRQRLAKSEWAFQDDTGQDLDKLEAKLRSVFGTRRRRPHKGRKHIISVLSKVAAFLRPERFVAYDQYARKGLNIVQGRAASYKFNGYADYLAMFDKAWHGLPGREIRDYVKKRGESKVENEQRFQRRVLDVYLMRRGGR